MKKKATKKEETYISFGGHKIKLSKDLVSSMVDLSLEYAYESGNFGEKMDTIVLNKVIGAIEATDFSKDSSFMTKVVEQMHYSLDAVLNGHAEVSKKDQKRFEKLKSEVLSEISDDDLKMMLRKKLLNL